MIFFLFCMLISNVHKSVIVINSIDTPFSRNVFEVVCVIICGLKSLAFGQRRIFPSSQRALRFFRGNCFLSCEQVLLFGRVKRAARELASERRSRKGLRKGELVTITHEFSFVIPSDEGKYHCLKNDVPQIKVD